MRKTAAGTRGLLILGIETSCDETAAAVVEQGRRVLADLARHREPPPVARAGLLAATQVREEHPQVPRRDGHAAGF